MNSLAALLAALLAQTSFPAADSSAAVAADSVEAAAEPAPASRLETTVTGFLDTRTVYQHPRPAGLSGTEAPQLANLTEGNVQLRLRFDPRAFASSDLSLFWQKAGVYASGGAHDVTAYRPQVVVSELYGSYEVGPHLQLTLGKKRVVWGPGLAQNPMDFVNPAKDPTDPANQRAGAWIGRVELPFETMTLSLVGAAKVLRQYAGLPTTLVYYPSFPTAEAAAHTADDDRDLQPHFALAARVYWLVADTDLNLVWAFTNLYNDAFQHKNRLGLSVSRAFGGLEAHVEAALQTGSSRAWPNEACAADAAALEACVAGGVALAAHTQLDSHAFSPRVLAGGRYMFGDNAMLSVEYVFNGEGLDAKGFAQFAQLAAAGKALAGSDPRAAAALASALNGGAQSADPGSPQRFHFEPLRRHYLFASYAKPQIADDFTLGASLVSSLSDLSGQLGPYVTWAPREWLSLNLTAYLGLPSPGRLGAEVGGRRYGELALEPANWSAAFSARAYY